MDYGHEQTDRALKKLEQKLAREYEAAKKDIERKLKNHLNQFDELDKKYAAQVDAGTMKDKDYKRWRQSAMVRTKGWEELRDNLASDLSHTNEIAIGLINDHAIDCYALNMNYGTYEIENGLHINTGFSMYDHKTVENLMRDEPQIIPKAGMDIPEDKRWNRQKLTSAITQGVLTGDSIPDIAKRLGSVADMNETAAVRNARTYTTAAENKGRTDSYERAQNMGIDLEQEWLATLDQRTRSSHRHLDGERVKIGAKFSNGCRYPGDPAGRPEEIYNCRCTLVAALKGYDYQDDRFSRLPKDMTYEEWKAGKDREANPPSSIVNGRDISGSWVRRPEQFAFEIEDIINAQGFDGLPRVVSSEEFDAEKKNAKVYGYRGYSAPDSDALKMYQNQLYTGKWYVDCSAGTAAYGQGMYMQGVTDLDDEAGIHLSKMIAEGYGKSRQGEAFNVEEMVMSKDAKGIALYRHKGSLTEAENYSDFHLDYMQKNATGEWSDIGVYAAAKGYDYIYFYDESGTQEIVVLNRTKLIIKGK